MNKTVSVNISGQLFVLDEEAFNSLNQYLHELHSHFTGRQGETEIIADIESRIAELLQSRLNEQKQVVDMQDSQLRMKRKMICPHEGYIAI
jgi:hypothetical protein